MTERFTLSSIAKVIDGQISGDLAADLSVDSINLNSKEITPGALFLALKGEKRDGHLYLDDAFNAGASAAVVSDKASLKGRAGIVVPDTRKIAGKLAKFIFADAQSKLTSVGVTGTNGKTTTNWIIYHLWRAAGLTAARIGTLGFESAELKGDFGLTTPNVVDLHQLLKKFVDNAVTHLVMEVSSHALDQGRVDGIDFDAAVFTNLTQDHLDYHKSLDQYFEAKWRLFDRMKSSSKGHSIAVLNADSEHGRIIESRMASRPTEIISYGESGTLQCLDFQQSLNGSRFTLNWKGKEAQVSSPFIGWHNVENVAAAFGALLGLGASLKDLCEFIKRVPQVPGRLEAVRGGQGFGVYVDYAHTPDALINVLKALKPLTKGKLWVLFGCGGDRDRGKRPLMREAACSLADQVVVTSDNPRSEDALSIINDIMSGVTAKAQIKIEADRATAISMCIKEAKSGDVVLIAGKGHEEYQIIGKETRHFSDVEEALKAVNARGAGSMRGALRQGQR